jgi:uncharacterized protein involved in exopolysaccharide biosynthesis
VPSVPPEITTLATYEKERAIAEAEAAAAADELAELKKQLDKEELMVVSQVINQRSGVADRLREGVAQAQTELAALHDKGYSDQHPECRELLARIDMLEKNYNAEIDEGLRIQSETQAINPVRMELLTRAAQLEGALAAATATRESMDAELGTLKSRIAALPGAMERVAGLQTELEVKAAVYEVVTNAYEMASVEAEEMAPKFTVLDEAIVPPKKIGPSGTRVCVATVIAGMLLGVMIAPSRDRARQARRKAREAEAGPEEGTSC